MPPAEPLAAASRAGAPVWWATVRRLAWRWLLGALVLLVIVAIALSWRASRRVAELEQELVRRQQDSAGEANEARLVARDAQEGVRDAAAKVALLEARVAEVAVQRSQLEELIQSLSRSRDENVLGDVEASIRVAMQQTVISGSAEPLVAALKQGDERLARYNLPRLENVRRAVGRDLDRIKSVGVTDIPSLAIKLDEAIRLVDDLPLLASADAHRELDATGSEAAAGASDAPVAVPGSGASAASRPVAPPRTEASTFGRWSNAADSWWRDASGTAWSQLRSLIRVTRVDHPDAMLLAPEQAFFVRENLKLRLLNARLALLSRQFDIAQSDITVARAALERYFERGARRTVLAAELVAQVAAQARQVNVPRPDDTLAALTAAGAGR